MSYIINKNLFLQNTKFYIYVHFTKDTNIPFYVGKGSYDRCLSPYGRNIWWKNIVNKHGYYIEIKEINLDEENCFQKEMYWIKFYGRKQLNTGSLINLTDGGEGVSGRIYTQKEKENLSKYWKENIDYLQNIGERKKYFGKILKGENNSNYNNKGKLNPISKPVVKLSLNGEFIEEYASCKEAEEKNNSRGVSYVCNRKRNQLKGFIYVYKKDYENSNYTIKLAKNNKKVVMQIDINTKEIIRKYNSVQETKNFGFRPLNVAQVARGDKFKKTHKGFLWKYE